jgi:hypothetical protein
MGGLCNSHHLLDHSTYSSFPALDDCPWVTFVARNILGDADEGHWKYYPAFSEPATFCLAQRIGEDNLEASAFLARSKTRCNEG